MKLLFVFLYLLTSIVIGLWASRRVKSSKDYLVANRKLPLYMSVATVFATWFGAETVLGVSATALKNGLRGTLSDPFGLCVCLVIVALFFARAFYRMDLLTIGDFYKKRYNRSLEMSIGLCITLSYLGWLSAQFTALGVVFHTLSASAIPLKWGICLGAGIVLFYTLFGGMWSIAFTDLFQTIMIIIGLVYVAFLLGKLAGGPEAVISHAHMMNKLTFWPKLDVKDILAFVSTFIVAALGSIPQQDVFQRITSAKSANTAVKGTLLGALLYLCMAFFPLFIAYTALVIEPSTSLALLNGSENENQLILPNLILNHTPPLAQIMFFGALVSAILSTASGVLLAPAAIFSENILKPCMPNLSDKQFLLLVRVVLFTFAAIVLIFALTTDDSIYEMVQNSYKVSLVSGFVPLVCGLYWKKANSRGALLSAIWGLAGWAFFEILSPEGIIPPVIIGLGFSFLGMFLGSMARRKSEDMLHNCD